MTESGKLACEGCGNACVNCANAVPAEGVQPVQSKAKVLGATGWTAVALMGIWLITLGYTALTGAVNWLTAVVLFWLVYNFIPWWVLRWRLLIVSRRGRLLGFGYAFAAGLVSTLAAETDDWVHTLTMMGINTVLLALPFVLPFALRLLPSRPHWTDLLVAVYFVSFLWWWPLDRAIGTWEDVRLAPFVAATALVTYFIGVRYWNRSVWELNVRRSDLSPTLAALAIIGAILFWEYGRPGGLGSVAPLPFLYSLMILGPVLAMAVFGVMQPTLAQLIRGLEQTAAQRVAALLAAAVFICLAFLHDVGIAPVAAGITAAGLTRRSGRLLPALLVISAYTVWMYAIG